MQQATKHPLIILGLAALVVGAMIVFELPPLVPAPAHPDFALEITQFMPGFSLTVDAHGNVDYGRGLVQAPADTKITPQQVDELVAAIEKADVFALKDKYYTSMLDEPQMNITITLDGRTKFIMHSPALACNGERLSTAPQALCDLESAILATLNLDQRGRPLAAP